MPPGAFLFTAPLNTDTAADMSTDEVEIRDEPQVDEPRSVVSRFTDNPRTRRRDHRRLFREWRREQANDEYQHFLNHRGPGSADGYKENHRYGRPSGNGILKYSEQAFLHAGEQWRDLLKQTVAHIKKRWRLRERYRLQA